MNRSKSRKRVRKRGFRFGILKVYAFATLALAMACGYFAVLAVGPEIRAARGEGTTGTFTAEELRCGRASCSWHGSFRSDDGRLLLSEAWISGRGEDELISGDKVPAFHAGYDGKVYAPGTHDLAGLVGFFVVDLLFVRLALNRLLDGSKLPWPFRRKSPSSMRHRPRPGVSTTWPSTRFSRSASARATGRSAKRS